MRHLLEFAAAPTACHPPPPAPSRPAPKPPSPGTAALGLAVSTSRARDRSDGWLRERQQQTQARTQQHARYECRVTARRRRQTQQQTPQQGSRRNLRESSSAAADRTILPTPPTPLNPRALAPVTPLLPPAAFGAPVWALACSGMPQMSFFATNSSRVRQPRTKKLHLYERCATACFAQNSK